MRTLHRCTGALVLVALPTVALTRPAEAAVADQTRTTFRTVSTEGTGCPAGTTSTRISDDGLVFTTTFSAFEATIDPGTQTTSRACRLTIKIHTPPGRSVSLRSFAASGYAVVDDGARGTYQAAYTFGGRPVTPRSAPRPPFTTPHDDSFVIRDDLAVGDAAWTPCGTEHELVITTSLTLHNEGGQGSGYLNVSAVDGSAEAESRLQERPCTPADGTGRVGDGPGSPRRPGQPLAVRATPRFTG